eukprot:m.198778 g.198778  ORF g.198778 m.198778 type:complete len:59 (+) comp39563_c1_seq2:1732-1908(+)
MPSSFGLREVEVRMDRASEYGFLASHTALLLGCLIKDNAVSTGYTTGIYYKGCGYWRS